MCLCMDLLRPSTCLCLVPRSPYSMPRTPYLACFAPRLAKALPTWYMSTAAPRSPYLVHFAHSRPKEALLTWNMILHAQKSQHYVLCTRTTLEDQKIPYGTSGA